MQKMNNAELLKNLHKDSTFHLFHKINELIDTVNNQQIKLKSKIKK